MRRKIPHSLHLTIGIVQVDNHQAGQLLEREWARSLGSKLMAHQQALLLAAGMHLALHLGGASLAIFVARPLCRAVGPPRPDGHGLLEVGIWKEPGVLRERLLQHVSPQTLEKATDSQIPSWQQLLGTATDFQFALRWGCVLGTFLTVHAEAISPPEVAGTNALTWHVSNPGLTDFLSGGQQTL